MRVDRPTIRIATDADTGAIAVLLSAMLEEMATHGGHPVAGDDTRRASFERRVAEDLACYDVRHVVAVVPEGAVVGCASARIVTIDDLFVPQQALHVSTVSVPPEHRRRGIATGLLEALLAWGRERGCSHADLNVLTRNPARALYERMGFTEVQHKLVRPL